MVTDPNGNDTTYHYDAAGRTDTVIDALGNERGSGYDSNGNVTTYTSPRGSESVSTFDEETNNLVGVDQPTGSGSTLTYSYGYDNDDHPYAMTSSTNSQGGVTSFSHDTVGRVTGVMDEASSAQASIDYNDDGTPRHQSTDPNGNVTTYSYEDGNLVGVSPPAPLGDVSISVDALSRVVSTTDGEGRTVSYSYDIADRVTQVTYPGVQVTYTYDTSGNLTSRSDASGTTTYDYDRLNRLTGETRPGDTESVYTYDATGNLRRIQQDGVGTTNYTFDDANQLSSAEGPRPAGEHGYLTTTFSYDEDGNRTHTTYPNGVTQTADIDDAGRLLEIEATRGSTTLTRFTYSYLTDDPDNPGEQVDTSLRQSVTDLDGVTTDYTYDEQSRLTDAVRTHGPSVLHDWSYDYDDKHQPHPRHPHNGDTTVSSFNAADQITDAGGIPMAYDGVGNLTDIGNGQTTFDYNGADQTTSITDGADTLDLAYAGDTQVERTSAGDTDFIYNALGAVVTEHVLGARREKASDGRATRSDTRDGR